MGTVILGGGIIGFSTAYYLSQSLSRRQPSFERPHASPEPITILDPSPTLFASASGYAAGFLARDWFGPALAPLGALSFDLHKELAKEYDGWRRWGYSPSTALSLAVDEGSGRGSARGEDWLLEGGSRVESAGVGRGEGDVVNEDGSPRWLTRQKGGSLEAIGEERSCAQVDPRRLCGFLKDQCEERGVVVKAHHEAISTTRDTDGAINGLMVQHLDDERAEMVRIPCSSLVLAAGAWTPSAFRTLFPESKVSLPISPLAGHSLVLKSPRHTIDNEEKYGLCHAIFAAPTRSIGFSPEIFSRVGGEIYIAGLNDANLTLPRLATDANPDRAAIKELRQVAVGLLGKAKKAAGKTSAEDDGLEIIKEGVCFRPAGRAGRPVVAAIPEHKLGNATKLKEGHGICVVAAGHGPWGITLSLGTGKVVAEMVEGVKTSARIIDLGL